MSKFQKEHIEFLKNNVKGKSLKELTKMFNNEFKMNANERSICNLKHRYHLRSDTVGGRFEKGQTPWNKGKKMPDYQYNKLFSTMFKKGNVPANRKPIGSERIDKRDGRVLIKIQDGQLNNNWMPKSRFIYEKEYGKIPDGYKIIFADGNNQNFDIDNLIMVSASEEFIMNQKSLIKKNKELTKIGATIAKILDKSRGGNK